MNGSTVAPADPDVISQVREAVSLARRVVSSAVGVTATVELDRFTLHGRVRLADLDRSDISRLITGGHLVDLQIGAGAWALQLRRGGSDGEVTFPTGPPADAVAQPQVDALLDALDTADFNRLIDLLQDHDAEMTLQIGNDPSVTGVHWAASSSCVITAVNSDLWIPFARRVADGAGILVLDDFRGAVLHGESLVIVGPDATDLDSDPTTASTDVSKLDLAFRTARASGGTLLPSPLSFADLSIPTGTVTAEAHDVAEAMRKLTALLTWSLLAGSSEPTTGAVAVQINGARHLDIEINPSGSGLEHLVEMYQWVATSPEIDRLYFAQQALTLAIVSPEDTDSAPEPALRTARSLYDLSRRSSVSEVMAARRSARETALSASRSAASQAREAASKAVERTVVQVLAAAAVVIAQLQDALSLNQSAALLGLLAAMCALSGVATDFVVLRSARDGLDQELRDLKRYRDTLSKDDVKSAKRTGAVRAARSDLRRARLTSWAAYGAATTALLVAAIVSLSLRADVSPEPAPTPSAEIDATAP